MKGALAFAAIALIYVGTTALGHAVKTSYSVKDHNKVVGCYWGTWAFYRPGYGKFDVDNVPVDQCTHGFYGFADLNNKTEDPHAWELVAYDPWYDQNPDDCNEWANNCDPTGGDGSICCHHDSYRRFVALKQKNPDFVPMISIGGWNAGSKKFSLMAADPAKRQIFLDSIVPFVKKYGFEGVDLDWEYPGAQGADPEEHIDADGDKEHFSVLVEMMAELLHEHDILFTAALSPGKGTIENAYDIPRISKSFDYMNVMTYDYHGWWGNNSHNFTGHNAPLHGREEETMEGHPGYMFSVFDTLKIWMDAGAPAEKLLMGFAQYGRGMSLSTEENGVYCPADAGIPAGPYTQQDGIWGYLEILQAFNNDTLINLPGATPHGWTTVVDDCYDAPYAYNGKYWISYDDQDSVELKAKYANLLGLAGVFGWSLETDDFEGRYFDQTYPLLRRVNEAIASGETYNPENPKCTGTAPMCPIGPTTTTTETATTTQEATTQKATTQEVDTTTPKHNDNDCTEAMQVFPMPGDCHKYYICLPTESDGIFDITVMDCKIYVFNPNIESCVDPNLPGNENICPVGP